MSIKNALSRRSILGYGALAGSLTALVSDVKADSHKDKKGSLISQGQVILFQGDSITDAGRDKKNQIANDQKGFGRGYAWMAASQLLISKPNHNRTLHNRGISGNKVLQLDPRWDKDCLKLKE